MDLHDSGKSKLHRHRSRGQDVRQHLIPPTGSRPVYLELAVPRVECRQCGAVRPVKIAVADKLIESDGQARQTPDMRCQIRAACRRVSSCETGCRTTT